MKRMTLVSLLIVIGVLLMQSGALAARVEPRHLLTSLNHQQQFEFFQALVDRGYDQQKATQIVRNAIAIRPPNENSRLVRILVLEDQPGELGPVAIVVVGDTVMDADVFQLTGDGAFGGPASDIIRFSFGGAAIFQGVPSLNDLLRLLVELRFRETNVVFRRFTIPPGRHTIQFSTGAQPPLDTLRFIASGNPDLKISRFFGTQGFPD
ncbi:MAG: hypothetical protein ACREBD_27680, partial [Blastocatellia bacterium]